MFDDYRGHWIGQNGNVFTATQWLKQMWRTLRATAYCGNLGRKLGLALIITAPTLSFLGTGVFAIHGAGTPRLVRSAFTCFSSPLPCDSLLLPGVRLGASAKVGFGLAARLISVSVCV